MRRLMHIPFNVSGKSLKFLYSSMPHRTFIIRNIAFE
jgi:hypothetical protein